MQRIVTAGTPGSHAAGAGCFVAALAATLLPFATQAAAAAGPPALESTPVIPITLARADEGDTIAIDDSASDSASAISISGSAGDEIVIEPGPAPAPKAARKAPPAPAPSAAAPKSSAEEIQIEPEAPPGPAAATPSQPTTGATPVAVKLPGKQWSIALHKARIEYGQLTKSSNPVNTSDYANAIVRINSPTWDKWELQLEARADAYLQTGTPNFQDVTADYGDNYIRYRGNNFRVTAGTQTILWGRIDEVAPEDRLSVVDLTRGILYALPDRRRAAPAVRVESFFGGNTKLDLVWLPYFRPADLPNKDSIWYPVNGFTGNILGIETTPLIRAVVRGARIDDSAPSGQNGFGARLSGTTGALDYGVTVQWNRQSLPYFQYLPNTNTLQGEYPESWVFGGDAGFQAAGAIWRAEAVYLTDVPVTTKLGQYETVGGVNWGAGVEFHPGDGDTRVNLQIIGRDLVNAPPIYDVYPYYAANGTLDWPFLHDRWRLKVRFNVGLNVNDVYINPEIDFLGWEPSEIYLGGHYFSGSNGTIGGFWQDDSMITLGWRGRF